MNIFKRLLASKADKDLSKKIENVKKEFVEATFDGDNVTMEYIETLSKLHGTRAKNKH